MSDTNMSDDTEQNKVRSQAASPSPPPLDHAFMMPEAAQRVMRFLVNDNLDGEGPPTPASDRSQSRLVSDEPEVGLPPLKCVSTNVQKSVDNLTVLLERHRDDDIVCVQEPPWMVIKRVASSKSKDGEEYLNTVANRYFVCLGASATSRVCTYVNKRWAASGPRIVPLPRVCPDVQCIALTINKTNVAFLNVYNDSKKFTVLSYLSECEDSLPRITFAVGDFNLHHASWDRYTRENPSKARHVGKAAELIEIMSLQNELQLINERDGPPTWVSNNIDQQDYVLDLLWCHRDITPTNFEIQPEDHFKSDYRVLTWELPIFFRHKPKLTVKRGSKEGGKFIRAARQIIGELPMDNYGSADRVQQISMQLAEDLKFAWEKCGKIPEITKFSKTWWNPECSKHQKAMVVTRARMKELKARRKAAQQTEKDHGPSFITMKEIQTCTEQLIQELDRLDTFAK